MRHLSETSANLHGGFKSLIVEVPEDEQSPDIASINDASVFIGSCFGKENLAPFLVPSAQGHAGSGKTLANMRSSLLLRIDDLLLVSKQSLSKQIRHAHSCQMNSGGTLQRDYLIRGCKDTVELTMLSNHSDVNADGNEHVVGHVKRTITKMTAQGETVSTVDLTVPLDSESFCCTFKKDDAAYLAVAHISNLKAEIDVDKCLQLGDNLPYLLAAECKRGIAAALSHDQRRISVIDLNVDDDDVDVSTGG